jgi:uncharacterized protein (DUF58 family)
MWLCRPCSNASIFRGKRKTLLMSIYPTWRLLAALSLMVLASLLVGLLAPHLWVWAPVVMLGLLFVALIDGLFAPPVFRIVVGVKMLRRMGVARPYPCTFKVTTSSRLKPRHAQLRFEFTGPIETDREQYEIWRNEAGVLSGEMVLRAPARGRVHLRRIYVRWRGYLGLVFVQKRLQREDEIIVTPDIEGVQRDASELFSRDSVFGVRVQNQLHNGSEFHALREYDASQDPRRIDWRSSARHMKLLSREFQAERNHHIVLAFDTGRLMGEPLSGIKRLDRAIYAGLLLGYSALKIGDNVKSYAFAARPFHNSATVSGIGGYEILKHQLSILQDTTEETNHTLALADLGAKIGRRSLIVLFTDFIDEISADLMLEALTRLGRKHQILFIAFTDEVVEDLIEAEPHSGEDITRAVFARRLQAQRERVHAQLKRMGVDVLEARSESMAMEIVSRYLAMKRQERL